MQLVDHCTQRHCWHLCASHNYTAAMNIATFARKSHKHSCNHTASFADLLPDFGCHCQLPAAMPIVCCFMESLALQFHKLIFYLSIFKVHNSICNIVTELRSCVASWKSAMMQGSNTNKFYLYINL